jgi:hypothetical protein
MYSLLYNKLPGGKLAKLLQVFVLMAAFVALLFFVIFPLVDTYLPEDPSLNG